MSRKLLQLNSWKHKVMPGQKKVGQEKKKRSNDCLLSNNETFNRNVSSSSIRQPHDAIKHYINTRSLGALRAPTSRLRPFGPALGPSGLLDFVLRALRALRPCDPRNGAMIVNTLSTDKHTIQRLTHYPSVNTIQRLTHYPSVNTISNS